MKLNGEKLPSVSTFSSQFHPFHSSLSASLSKQTYKLQPPSSFLVSPEVISSSLRPLPHSERRWLILLCGAMRERQKKKRGEGWLVVVSSTMCDRPRWRTRGAPAADGRTDARKLPRPSLYSKPLGVRKRLCHSTRRRKCRPLGDV